MHIMEKMKLLILQVTASLRDTRISQEIPGLTVQKTAGVRLSGPILISSRSLPIIRHNHLGIPEISSTTKITVSHIRIRRVHGIQTPIPLIIEDRNIQNSSRDVICYIYIINHFYHVFDHFFYNNYIVQDVGSCD